METDVRAALERLKKQSGESYAALSRMIRRNDAYLQQFVTRGTPKRPEERDRALLAAFFRVDEEVLGGPPARGLAMVQVARLDVDASAGPGSLIDSEVQVGAYGFDGAWLRAVSSAKSADLSIIRVTGDSMAPSLIDGDDVLVDQSSAGRALRDGILSCDATTRCWSSVSPSRRLRLRLRFPATTQPIPPGATVRPIALLLWAVWSGQVESWPSGPNPTKFRRAHFVGDK